MKREDFGMFDTTQLILFVTAVVCAIVAIMLW